MRARAIVAGAVVLAILFIAWLFFIPRKPPQDITLRHIKSLRTENMTSMSFEVKNRTANPYIFFPFQVQIRNGNGWTNFQDFDMTKIHPSPKIGPKALASYTLYVTNLPAGSHVRFVIRPQKVLLGASGFIRRAELEMDRKRRGTGGSGIPLNPYDKSSQVYGMPIEVVSEEFIEAER